VTAFVVANVVLYNFFFDVPVKLYAAHLLIMALFVVLPDVRPLFDFFWRHKPSAPTGVWVPPASRPIFRWTTVVIEGLFLISCVATSLYYSVPVYRKQAAARREASPLRGGWHLDSSVGVGETAEAGAKPILTGDGLPMTELYIDTLVRGCVRSSDGVLWRAFFESDSTKHTLQIAIRGTGGFEYTAALPDINHLVLTPSGKGAARSRFCDLRGFHWRRRIRL